MFIFKSGQIQFERVEELLFSKLINVYTSGRSLILSVKRWTDGVQRSMLKTGSVFRAVVWQCLTGPAYFGAGNKLTVLGKKIKSSQKREQVWC